MFPKVKHNKSLQQTAALLILIFGTNASLAAALAVAGHAQEQTGPVPHLRFDVHEVAVVNPSYATP